MKRAVLPATLVPSLYSDLARAAMSTTSDASTPDCSLASYSNRINDDSKCIVSLARESPPLQLRDHLVHLCPAGEYDWCIVPDSGYDVIVFAGIAVLVACCFRGKFSNLMILIAGTD